ncbi:MAG: DUF2007 domain-containing protein [Desulfobacterales bacterium]|nr:DUF2007 domain-containing protein [Desulfobacterales bacterium]
MKEHNDAKMARIIGSIIFIGSALFSLLLSVKLYLESDYRGCIGWFIISAVFIFYTWLCHLDPKETEISEIQKPDYLHIRQIKKNEDFVLLFSTKDHNEVARIREALINEGIECVVLDRHSSTMMSFLPDVEMRIMVSGSDFEKSVRIYEDLWEGVAS